jgi:phage terminase Nu1 subunit (DNA packaging protein)
MNFKALKRVELAEVFRVTTRTVTRWAADGMPRRGDGRFDLGDCIAWRVELAERAGQVATDQAPATESPEASKWLEKYRKERALLARMERRQRQGALIEREKLEQELVARAFDLRTTFRSYKHRLGSMLEGKTRDQIMQILGEENDRLLRTWCKARRFVDSSLEYDALPDWPEVKATKTKKEKIK